MSTDPRTPRAPLALSLVRARLEAADAADALRTGEGSRR